MKIKESLVEDNTLACRWRGSTVVGYANWAAPGSARERHFFNINLARCPERDAAIQYIVCRGRNQSHTTPGAVAR